MLRFACTSRCAQLLQRFVADQVPRYWAGAHRDAATKSTISHDPASRILLGGGRHSDRLGSRGKRYANEGVTRRSTRKPCFLTRVAMPIKRNSERPLISR